MCYCWGRLIAHDHRPTPNSNIRTHGKAHTSAHLTGNARFPGDADMSWITSDETDITLTDVGSGAHKQKCRPPCLEAANVADLI